MAHRRPHMSPDDLDIGGDPFAAVERAAEREADDVILGDFFRRTGRDLRGRPDTEIPSGLLR